MAKWFIGNKEVSLKEYRNYLDGDKNIVDVVEKEEVKVKSEVDKLFEELTNKVGFSHKRAEKVIKLYKSKEDLLNDLDSLPFDKIENETLVKYFGKKTKKKKIKEIIKETIESEDSYEGV